jgi:hypothetical protein
MKKVVYQSIISNVSISLISNYLSIGYTMNRVFSPPKKPMTSSILPKEVTDSEVIDLMNNSQIMMVSINI